MVLPLVPSPRSLLSSLLAGLLLALAPPAAAQDRFEVQVYDTEVAHHLEPGLELHTNWVASGEEGTSADGELGTHHVAHLTLEPHLGLFGVLELGGYLQAAVRPEGELHWAGFKLRTKARWPEKLWGKVGLALNVELSRIPARYEPAKWGSEVRPAIDARFGGLYVAFNPILAIDLAGEEAGRPQFEPAAKVAWFFADERSIGVEAYAGLGPIDAPVPVSQRGGTLYLVLDTPLGPFDLNLGIGRGSGTADAWVVKTILAWSPTR